MPAQLTIRGVSDQLAERLRGIANERQESVNTIVLRILEEAVGLDARMQRLDRYATWTEQDLEDFETTLREQRQVDDELWR